MLVKYSLRMNDSINALSTSPNAPTRNLRPDYTSSSAWLIDMNYLMPFSVMLMILCVLLLILCYLRHRMRQRRQLRHELQLRHMLSGINDMQRVDGK